MNRRSFVGALILAPFSSKIPREAIGGVGFGSAGVGVSLWTRLRWWWNDHFNRPMLAQGAANDVGPGDYGVSIMEMAMRVPTLRGEIVGVTEADEPPPDCEILDNRAEVEAMLDGTRRAG